MTIVDFSELISPIIKNSISSEAVWVGKTKADYNVKYPDGVYENVAIVELTDWPAIWRPTCGYKIRLRLWLGISVNFDEQGLTARDDLHELVNTVLLKLNDHHQIHLLDASPYQYYDAQEGLMLDNFAWVTTEIILKAYDN